MLNFRRVFGSQRFSTVSQPQLSATSHSLLKQIYTYSFYEHYLGYIILDHKDKSIIAIDPGDYEVIFNNVAMFKHQFGYNFTHVLQTHGQSKHTQHLGKLRLVFPDLKLMCGDCLQDTTCTYTHLAQDLVPIQIGELSVCFMKSPGHSVDNFIIAVTHEPNGTNSRLPILFTGDTLLPCSIGTVQNYDDFHQTLNRLRGFPNETLIFPGHRLQKENLLFAKTLDPNNPLINMKIQLLETQSLDRQPTTLAEERQMNPYLKLNKIEILKESDPVECIRKLKLIQKNFF